MSNICIFKCKVNCSTESQTSRVLEQQTNEEAEDLNENLFDKIANKISKICHPESMRKFVTDLIGNYNIRNIPNYVRHTCKSFSVPSGLIFVWYYSEVFANLSANNNELLNVAKCRMYNSLYDVYLSEVGSVWLNSSYNASLLQYGEYIRNQINGHVSLPQVMEQGPTSECIFKPEITLIDSNQQCSWKVINDFENGTIHVRCMTTVSKDENTLSLNRVVVESPLYSLKWKGPKIVERHDCMNEKTEKIVDCTGNTYSQLYESLEVYSRKQYAFTKLNLTNIMEYDQYISDFHSSDLVEASSERQPEKVTGRLQEDAHNKCLEIGKYWVCFKNINIWIKELTISEKRVRKELDTSTICYCNEKTIQVNSNDEGVLWDLTCSHANKTRCKSTSRNIRPNNLVSRISANLGVIKICIEGVCLCRDELTCALSADTSQSQILIRRIRNIITNGIVSYVVRDVAGNIHRFGSAIYKKMTSEVYNLPKLMEQEDPFAIVSIHYLPIYIDDKIYVSKIHSSRICDVVIRVPGGMNFRLFSILLFELIVFIIILWCTKP